MTQTIHPDLPLALAENEHVEKFSAVDGAAFIFATMPATANVRAELDAIYADTDLSFWTARHASTVDVSVDAEYDMLFIYDRAKNGVGA